MTTTSGTVVTMGLTSVQRPDDVAERWGEYTLAPADTSGFTYEDDLVSVAVVPAAGTFSTLIENKTQHSIRLLWAVGSYVGPTGLSSGIVPGETRWIDMNDAPAAQVIPSNSRAAATIIPKANTNTAEMEIEGFFPRTTGCDEIPGRVIRLILPLEIQGVVNEYTLVFEPQEAAQVTWQIDTLAGTVVEDSRTPCWE